MKCKPYLRSVLALLLLATCSLFAERVSDLPAPTGYIDDYAQVLSPTALSSMETTARELHNKTHAQVFLVTVNTLEGEPVETFANELFAKWKIGEKKTDRGVLLLFAIKDRKRWIEIGYGLEGILNDAKVGDIGRSMLPDLRAGRYDQATALGLAKISGIVAAESGVTLDSLAALSNPEQQPLSSARSNQRRTRSLPSYWGFLFPLTWLAILSFVIIRAIRRNRRRWTGSGGSPYVSGWSDSSFDSDSSSSSFGDSGGFDGGDGGSSGGGGAGGDW